MASLPRLGPLPHYPRSPSPPPSGGSSHQLLPYLLPARLPISFPNLFGNKASVHSQGLAGWGGAGRIGDQPLEGMGVVRGGGAPSWVLSLEEPCRSQLYLEFVQTHSDSSRGVATRERS